MLATTGEDDALLKLSSAVERLETLSKLRKEQNLAAANPLPGVENLDAAKSDELKKMAEERVAWDKEKQSLQSQIAAAVAAAKTTDTGSTDKAVWAAEKVKLEGEVKAAQDSAQKATQTAEELKTKAAAAPPAGTAVAPTTGSAAVPTSDDPHWQHMLVTKSGPHYKLVVSPRYLDSLPWVRGRALLHHPLPPSPSPAHLPTR